jgi:hypothetical protein
MVTVQQVYDAAIDLMDEANETTGATKTADTREYELRTISILNTALPVLYPYSSNANRTAPGRPTPPPLLAHNRREPDFTQEIPLDDALCWSLLPFYLASLLRSGEDTEFSMRMMTEYNNALASIRDLVPAQFEAIPTPYGLF